MKERCKQLLIDNPNLSLKNFKQLTGFGKAVYDAIKNEIDIKNIEDIALRINVKRNLKFYLKNSLKGKGYINEKGTFLERM